MYGYSVANLLTTAEKITENGQQYYIVNGLKKFISGGMKAHWLTVAVRTGGAGMGGVSLLLVDTSTPGITRTRMKTQGMYHCNINNHMNYLFVISNQANEMKMYMLFIYYI